VERLHRACWDLGWGVLVNHPWGVTPLSHRRRRLRVVIVAVTGRRVPTRSITTVTHALDLHGCARYTFVLVATLALLAAGCGGGRSDKKANEAYANSVCTAIGSWASEVKGIATNVSGGVSKASLDAKLAQFETATKNLVSQIKAVPAPNTSQGQAAKKQIDQLASQVEATTAAAKSTAEKIPANATARQAVAALATLAPQLNTLASSARSTVKAVEGAGGSLASAFESSRACKNLGG
jgi:hypothetical protein